ncbi:MAG: sensor histidine kinase [Chloroflexi bacterium]|nr:sensor histidine kinase [Chloroflexota bacterium]
MTNPTAQAKAIVVQTQEEERYRLARMLQAGPAQLLANATFEIETCLRLIDTQPQTAHEGLESLLRELQQGLTDIRDLISNLQPPLLEELGLVAGLRKYVARFSEQTNIPVDLIGWEQLTERLPATVELSIFRIVQEALENIRHHSQASHAQVEFSFQDGYLTVLIVDNGKGFAPTSLAPGRRWGLVMMQDRAELLEGNLQIFSEPGNGVRVIFTAPLRVSILNGN